MLDFLVMIAFCTLGFKVLGLLLRMAWGTAKIAASILLGLAVPLLVICLLFVGGIAVLLPLAMIGAAFGIVKQCI